MSKSTEDVAKLQKKLEDGKEIKDADALYLRDRDLLPKGVVLDDDPANNQARPEPEPKPDKGKDKKE